VRTCRLVTLGCKVNQYETQLVKEALLRAGFREAAEAEPADLCVVNTCTVTENADSRGRQVVRQLARENPNCQTIVTGCYATHDPAAIAKLPNVIEVVPDKRELPDVLLRLGVAEFPTGISRFDGHKRAFVKVQDGCLLRCSYCIIPMVRPGLSSRSPDDIEAEVRRLIEFGYEEIVLTGIHVGHYGVDTTRGRSGLPPFRLWHLLQRLDQIPGRWRLRLSSIEAAEFSDDFISAAADCEHLCPHFHPALQSGSDTVLARMRRRYRVAQFLETVAKLHERLPNPALSTDVIVGFPGETDFHEDSHFSIQPTPWNSGGEDAESGFGTDQETTLSRTSTVGNGNDPAVCIHIDRPPRRSLSRGAVLFAIRIRTGDGPPLRKRRVARKLTGFRTLGFGNGQPDGLGRIGRDPIFRPQSGERLRR